MVKRSQITLFLLLGLVILGVVVLLVYSRSSFLESLGKGEQGKVAVHQDVEGINSFVRGCVDSVGKDAVGLIGERGGYFLFQKLSVSSGVPYYFVEGESYMPSRDLIERELSSYINMNLFFCTRSFVDFEGFDVDFGRISTDVEIKEDEVVFDVNYPLVISKGNNIFRLNKFDDIVVPVRLGRIYDTVYGLMEDQLEVENGVCLSCLLDYALENDLYVEMFDYDSDSVMFIIRDENSLINEKPYEFVFVNRYEK